MNSIVNLRSQILGLMETVMADVVETGGWVDGRRVIVNVLRDTCVCSGCEYSGRR